MKRFLPTLAVPMVVVGLLLLGGCGANNESDARNSKQKPALVDVQVARRTTISRTFNTTGEVVAVNSVTIAAMVDGPIVFCPWREGDQVEKAGQKLIEIGRESYRAEVKAAEAALALAKARLADLKAGSRPQEISKARETVRQHEEIQAFAKIDMERIEKMVASGSLPGEALEKARVQYVSSETQAIAARKQLEILEAGPTKTAVAVQAAMVDEADARLALAKAKLSECTIPAPFAATITRVHVRPGDLATAKAPLLEMADLSSLAIRFALPESEAVFVRQGLSTTITLDAYAGRVFTGEITRVYPELDRRMRTRTIEAVVTQDVDLVPGMFARLRVEMETVTDAVVVPTKAVMVTPKGGRIVNVVESGRISQRKVVTGIEDGARIQILEGIRSGEQVVVSGGKKLKDGAAVQLRKDKDAPGKKQGQGQASAPGAGK